MLAHALETADEHAKTRRVDVPDFFQIDDQVVMFLIDQLGDRVFDLG